MNAQESEVRGPLHTVPIDEQGLNASFLSPAVNNQFLGLGTCSEPGCFLYTTLTTAPPRPGMQSHLPQR